MKKLVLIISLLCGQMAFAHSLHLFAQNDGHTIEGKAYYSDQTPAAETYVGAYLQGQQSEDPILEGKTDSEGRFSLTVTQQGTYRVVVEGEEGHRASVVADNVQATSASTASANDLLILREDINQLKNRILVRDILGGVGYIVGALGLCFFLGQRRKKVKDS